MSKTPDDHEATDGGYETVEVNLVQKRTQLFERGVSQDISQDADRGARSEPGAVNKVTQDGNAKRVVSPSRTPEKTWVKDLPPKPAVLSPKPKTDGVTPKVIHSKKTSASNEAGSVVANAAKLFGGEDTNTAPSGPSHKLNAVAPPKPKSTVANPYGEEPAGYAQVRKSLKKKLHPSRSQEPSKSGLYSEVAKDVRSQRTLSQPSSQYDGVLILPTSNGQNSQTSVKLPNSTSAGKTKPVPPQKPPRTFAYDEYLETKRAKASRKAMRDRMRATNYEEIDEGDLNPGYEEVDVKPTVRDRTQDTLMYEDVSDFKTKDSQPAVRRPEAVENMYEEVAQPLPPSNNVAAARRHFESSRVPNSKLPPPPRPPLPSESRLDSPVVRINKHIDRLKPDSFVGKNDLSNPAYEEQHHVLKIKSYPPAGMKRCASDEYLYVDSRPSKSNTGLAGNPIYMDPHDVYTPSTHTAVRITQHGVVLDADGYAEPINTHNKLSRQHSDVELRKPSKYGSLSGRAAAESVPAHFMTSSHRPRPAVVSEKLSRAYSVLRLNQGLDRYSTDEAALQCISEENADDSDNEVDMDEHRKKLEYLCTVKLKCQIENKPLESLKKLTYSANVKSQKLFGLVLVVGLVTDPNTNKTVAKTINCFPPQESKQESDAIAEFCFPDAVEKIPVVHYTPENFTFILTGIDGSRRYGHCRRYLPSGSKHRFPEAVCIVSSLGSWQFYRNLFTILEERRKFDLPVSELLQAAHNRPLPKPGMEVYASVTKEDGRKEAVILRRHDDPRLEGVSHDVLFQFLKTDTLLKVFASILLERRIIFVAKNISTLSDCIQAITSLLFPFSWQHVLVPVLPYTMLGVCASPTPFILGILESCMKDVDSTLLEEVLIVDLDRSNLQRCQGDEARIIPKKLQRALTAALKDDTETRENRSLLITEAFLRLFVETTGHYTDYFSQQQDGLRVFQKEVFVRDVSNKSIRLFLEWFTETQMFEVFMTEKLESPQVCEGLFEERILDYREEMMKMNPTVKQNMKDMGKRMQNFFVDVGGKLKKALGRRHVFV